jgi:hypothetical protein
MITGPALEAEIRYRREVLTGGRTPARRPVMKVLCSWCRRVLRNGHAPVSHGICSTCEQEHLR